MADDEAPPLANPPYIIFIVPLKGGISSKRLSSLGVSSSLLAYFSLSFLG